NAKRFNIPASPFSQGMVAVLAELKARRINGDKLTAYMTRVIALMDVLSDPGAAREFVRPGDEPGHVVFSESLVGASAATAMHSNPSLRMRGPRPNHSAIDTEMLVAEQLRILGLLHHPLEQRAHHLMLDQPVAALGVGAVIPRHVAHAQADEPAIQHVVAQLLTQQPLAPNAVERLQHQPAQQPFRRHRVAPTLL